MATKKRHKENRVSSDAAETEAIGADEATATFQVLDPERLDDVSDEADKSERDTESGVEESDESRVADCSDAGATAEDNRQDNGEAPTILSLSRLEEDLSRLQQSWSDVEQQLAAKDAEIAYLSDEREVHMAAFKSLQAELDEQLDEQDRQQDVIASLEARLAEAEHRLEHHHEIVAERDSAIESLRSSAADAQAALVALEQEKSALESQVAVLKEQLAEAADEKQAGEGRVAAIRADMQALEAYVDRRKIEWDALTKKLDDYKAALDGMRAELEDREKTIAEHGKVTAGLSMKVDELRQRCAELDGRRAERELANKELNDLLAEKSREIESLRKERDDACEGSKAMVSRLHDQQVRIDTLEHEVAELGCRLKEIRETADRDVETTRQKAREEIAAANQRLEQSEAEVNRLAREAESAAGRLAELEAEVHRRDEALELLRDTNLQLENRLVDESSRVAEINTELGASRSAEAQLKAEYEAYQEDAERRLEAHAELIAKLENELDERNAAIELLEKNADKLGAINQNIRQLDQRIVAGVRSSERRLSALTGRNLTLAVEGMPPVKFPIYKSCMTIGRSGDSDIQLRRKYISRQHARLTEDENGIRIEDLGSKNGLYVNAEPVKVSYLHNGDVVDIGEVQLRYIEDEQAA